jgi:hypothetical protein
LATIADAVVAVSPPVLLSVSACSPVWPIDGRRRRQHRLAREEEEQKSSGTSGLAIPRRTLW